MTLRQVGQKVRKDSIFDEVLIERLSDKVTFEQNLEEGVSHIKHRDKECPQKKSRPCKGSKVGAVLKD